MSLGLVSYDDSEESENEVETDNIQAQISTKLHDNGTSGSPTTSKITTSEGNICSETHPKNNEETKYRDSPEHSINLAIPESKISVLNTDIDIKYLTSSNKKAGPVKITIPSLNDVSEIEEEQPLKKKLKPSQKGCGLFALLPSPKGNLVPQSVARPNNKHKAANTKPTPIPGKNIKVTPKSQFVNKPSLITYEDSEDEDESAESIDFFSLDSKEDVSPAPIDIDIIIPQAKTVPNSPPKNQNNEVLNFNSNFQHPSWPTSSNSVHSSLEHVTEKEYNTSDLMTFDNKDLELDEQAMQQLCGRRDRLKMQAQNVSVIDVSGDTLMPDSREWLTKQLTEETNHRPSHKRKDGPTSQQKRKHQITYLAFQAKENELELKNQWANSRMSRKQTQAKYGF